MNLLNEAIPALTGLIKSQNITILNKSLENVKGFPKETISEVETFAHIQPLTPRELQKVTSGTLDTEKSFKFYCISNIPKVLNSIEKIECLIKWNNDLFRVFGVENWALNGWVMVMGSQLNDTPLNDDILQDLNAINNYFGFTLENGNFSNKANFRLERLHNV